MIFITGDTHGDFNRVTKFCFEQNTSTKDTLIILGDSGINYYKDSRAVALKRRLSMLPITIFSIYGNHEERPENIPSYKTKWYKGGIVYYEEEYPNLLFAKDGEIFDLDGKKTIVIGGAYSIDKIYRLRMGYNWYPDEQPSDTIKEYVETQLANNNWTVDVVLSYTAPLKYEPTEFFMQGIDQSKVDKSTERWLNMIEGRLKYKRWYFGHYHHYKKIDKMTMLFKEIDIF